MKFGDFLVFGVWCLAFYATGFRVSSTRQNWFNRRNSPLDMTEKNIKKLLRFGAGFSAGLLLGIGAVAGAAGYDNNIEKDFPAGAG